MPSASDPGDTPTAKANLFQASHNLLVDNLDRNDAVVDMFLKLYPELTIEKLLENKLNTEWCKETVYLCTSCYLKLTTSSSVNSSLNVRIQQPSI